MKLLQRIKTLIFYKYTLLFIPHSNSTNKQINIYPSVIIGTLIIFMTVNFSMLSHHLYLFRVNQSTEKFNTYLLMNYKNDKFAINEFKKNTDLANDKINSLLLTLHQSQSEYELKLAELSKLEESMNSLLTLIEEEESLELVTTRSFNRNVFFDDKTKNLAELIDTKIKNYSTIEHKIEDKIHFNECLPDQNPLPGSSITSPFGYRKHPVTGVYTFHDGLDLANGYSSNIKAAGSGIVTFSGTNGGYGNVIVISHGYGYKTVYAHNKDNLVSVGQEVNKGDTIAIVGNTGRSTGPHLHFEIHYSGKQINPLSIISLK